jgi:nitrate reductase gamma subunit
LAFEIGSSIVFDNHKYRMFVVAPQASFDSYEALFTAAQAHAKAAGYVAGYAFVIVLL